MQFVKPGAMEGRWTSTMIICQNSSIPCGDMQWQSHEEPTRRNIAEHHLFIIELHLAVHMVQLRCLCSKRVCVRGGHHPGEQEELPEDIRVMLSEYAKMSKAVSAAYGRALGPTFEHITLRFGFDTARSLAMTQS